MSENVNIRNDANDEVEIDLVEVFGILMHHIWLIITVVATVSSLLPARRAARFTIVDALRFA